jgi:uncharacterized membrane protein
LAQSPTGDVVRCRLEGPDANMPNLRPSGHAVAARRILAGIVVPATLAIALGQGLVPGVLAASSLTLTTPYPAVVVGPGTKVSFDLSVKTSPAARVDLSVSGAPGGWTATLFGGGFVIDAVQTNGTDAATARLDVSVPSGATGSGRIVVKAIAGGQSVDLPLDIRVEAQAAGDVTLTPDAPSKIGSASSTFTFNLTLDNGTAQDLTFAATAQGPDGWTTDATLTGLTQAASAIVKAGSTAGITVTAKPPNNVAAGKYEVDASVTAGSKQVQTALEVDITGSYSLTMSTPTQVLSTSGSSGSATEQQLTITNGGTAPVTNVNVSGSGATNWTITFDQPTIASIAPGATTTVTAKITPSSDAIAGDYQLTFSASGDQANATESIRFTVQTSLQWALVGIVLIVAVAAGLWWVFRRFGRR